MIGCFLLNEHSNPIVNGVVEDFIFLCECTRANRVQQGYETQFNNRTNNTQTVYKISKLRC